jgi:hypothetical protein
MKRKKEWVAMELKLLLRLQNLQALVKRSWRR